MLSPNDKKLGNLDPFYRPSVAKPKTSAEIISEARNALRTVRTQRPFTPQEDQRKLFGPASSRTPENRPPSSFSLHASSFESSDSRPISGTRLSPLELKPKAPASPTTKEDPCLAFPKPPVDPAKIRRVSSARARLFRVASQVAFLPDRTLPSAERKKTIESKERIMTGDSMVKINGIYLTESNAIGHLKSHPLQLTYGGGFREIKEQEAASLPSHLRSGGDQGERRLRAASCPNSSDLSSLETKAVSKANSQEKDIDSEVDDIFWNTRIVPILHELEKESLLEVLRSEDLQTNTEAFLYCMGTIKFISGNPRFLNEMISKGAVEILMNLIKQINENTKKCSTCLPNSGHLLVQMTATLRNLVDSPLARRKLLSISALPQLCVVMGQHTDDKDVCTNIARIFSKLTSYHDCCVALASYSRCYALFLNLINKYQKKQDLVVRIVFILGNLTAKNNQAREQFSKEKGSIPTLLSLFHTFSELDLHSRKQVAEGEEQPKAQTPQAQVEDVLIKLTRVLANLAIHPGIGQALAANPHVVGLLLSTLEYKSIDDCEELVINTTATINNLSYYQVKNSIIQDKKLHIAELLLKLLMSNNMDGILEAVRVLGNLSQDHDICNFIVQKNVHKFLIALLDAKHQDICFSACGVLLNLTVDKDKRVILKEGGGIKKLVGCLRDFGPTDWQLACLVCKTLWNFSENITNASSCFGDEDTNTLLVLLSSFLDEELALDGSSDQELKNYHKLHWETEFKPVAQQLLNRIQSHHTFLEPLPIPSF
ncbi:Armadillo repeat-containing protein 2 [Pteropus alecto]|uniref:Armadillo repeat-containing protein 2 n=1 Tax=Pteropus alecto TaxID=9402 RepID=L5JR58_PTEAL|nr:Armadillo repeat-containing protein 2 [Pteropus alecto]